MVFIYQLISTNINLFENKFFNIRHQYEYCIFLVVNLHCSGKLNHVICQNLARAVQKLLTISTKKKKYPCLNVVMYSLSYGKYYIKYKSFRSSQISRGKCTVVESINMTPCTFLVDILK